MISRRKILQWLGLSIATAPFADKLLAAPVPQTPAPGPKPATASSAAPPPLLGSCSDIQLAVLHTPHGQLYLGDVDLKYEQDLARYYDDAGKPQYLAGRTHGTLTAKIAFGGEEPLKRLTDVRPAWNGEITLYDSAAADWHKPSLCLQGVRWVSNGNFCSARDNWVHPAQLPHGYYGTGRGPHDAAHLMGMCAWMTHDLIGKPAMVQDSTIRELHRSCPILATMIRCRLAAIHETGGGVIVGGPCFVATCDNLQFTFTSLNNFGGDVDLFWRKLDEAMVLDHVEPFYVTSDHDEMIRRGL